MDSVRMDIWLWAARFFKTRALSKKACELGRIESNGHPAKAAREVHVGDQLKITNDTGDFQVEVLLVNDVRGPAAAAQTMYRESDESRAARQKASAERKAAQLFEPIPQTKPSKRDRRKIIQFRGGARNR
jgi:ribosome-associated heat shock protein Hsp15